MAQRPRFDGAQRPRFDGGSATTPMNFNIGNDIADGTGRRSGGFPNPPAVSIRI